MKRSPNVPPTTLTAATGIFPQARKRRRAKSGAPLPQIIMAVVGVLTAWAMLATGSVAATEPFPVRIAIYNDPPLAYLDGNGKPTGFMVELFSWIGKHEGWKVEFVYCGRAECWNELVHGKVDLLAPVVFSRKRTKIIDFNSETILINAGAVYTRGKRELPTFFALQGREVAVLAGGIFYSRLRQLLAHLDVRVRFVEVPSYHKVFALLREGRVSAGVVNRFFGITHQKRYGVRGTPIVFHPVEVRIAATKGAKGDLLAAVDRRLRELRANQGSYFYCLIGKWMNLECLPAPTPFYRTRLFLGTVGLLLFAVALALIFRFHIARKTRDLQASLQRLKEEVKQREIAQKALKETETRYRTLFHGAQNALVVLNAEGRFVECNLAAAHLFQMAPEKMIGLDPVVVSPDRQADGSPSAAKAERLISAALKGHPQRFEWLHKRPDGETFNAEVRLDYITYGGSSALLASIRDITLQKKFTQWLSYEKDRLEAVLDGSPIATFLIDPDGKVVLWNRTCEDLTQIPRQTMLGKPINLQPLYQGKELPVLADLLLRHDIETIIERYGQAGIRQLPYHPEGVEVLTQIHVEGQTYHLHAVATRIRDEEGNLLGIIQCGRDITKEVQLQNELLHSQKMEAIGRLAGGIAHDFNNILTILFGYVDLLTLQYKEDQQLRKRLLDIKRVADRAADLTNQLLAFSRKQILEVRVTDLNEVIRKTHKMLVRLIGEDIRLETRLEDHLWRIKADPVRLEQIIMNLVVNARDAMPHGGFLRIATRNETLEQGAKQQSFTVPANRYAVLSVTDTGDGIDPAIMEKIFDPFFTTKGKGLGTGLGLSTVYGIVKQLGGFVVVHSTPGRGTTFEIFWPRTSSDATPVRPVSTEATNCQGGSETILVVEDDPSVREILVRSLSRLGYQVLSAAHGEEALQQCRRHTGPIDLLLTDIVMPGMNGTDLAREIKAVRPDIRVLYVSGYTDDQLAGRGLVESEVHFLAKPFSSQELAQRVREVLSG